MITKLNRLIDDGTEFVRGYNEAISCGNQAIDCARIEIAELKLNLALMTERAKGARESIEAQAAKVLALQSWQVDTRRLLRSWLNRFGSTNGLSEETRTALAGQPAPIDTEGRPRRLPDDPCPQCMPGGICKKPSCGRLRSSELMDLYGIPAPKPPRELEPQRCFSSGCTKSAMAGSVLCQEHYDKLPASMREEDPAPKTGERPA